MSTSRPSTAIVSANSTAAPRVMIAWSRDARRCDLPDTSRAALHRAVRRAIVRCVATAPFISEIAASKYRRSIEVSVGFVCDEEIATLNAQYRNKNRPTDVLSWSQCEGEFPDWPASSDDDDATNTLGDIVFSIETAIRQARERAHSLETELSFLAVHGTLHLLGYDHHTSSQRRAMWKWQEQIVAALSVSRTAAL